MKLRNDSKTEFGKAQLAWVHKISEGSYLAIFRGTITVFKATQQMQSIHNSYTIQHVSMNSI